ncbi:TetR/AcrR family transcriptional regulator [Microterricola viridarii]|uniref:TetR family transcriptional regulator n=1 Tax=Microterricola viridarii TaxID=412690 RepID=A0A0X8E1X8_9MICO|nr:TetR/AcrR family transcriptional regulator [Microterricola viridarii]AMB58870.1 TetR family transcriptional regulator [Microterricola viridarii]
MPTPERTSREAILAVGREILEADGLAGLTMQAVASRVGVKAPSLYKRIRNRDELVRLIAEATITDLGAHLRLAAAEPADAAARVAALAVAFRAFAHRFPAGFHLIFAPGPAGRRPAHDTIVASSAPILEAAGALAGPAHALDAARTVTAWANGFISMELAGAFNLGGDVDEAFSFGIRTLTSALETRAEA